MHNSKMIRVVIESPLAGDFTRNLHYARLCALDCVRRGEAPYASHLFFTQFLDDARPSERETGIAAGLVWGELADMCVVYNDLGVTDGMNRGIDAAGKRGQLIQFRSLPTDLLRVFERDGFAQATEGALDRVNP